MRVSRPRGPSHSVHKPHAAMATLSSCMGGTFRVPRPKGAPFLRINVSPSIKTDIKCLNTKRPGLSCKYHCKKIVCYYFRPLKTIQSKKRREIHSLRRINASPLTLRSGKVEEGSHRLMYLSSDDKFQRIYLKSSKIISSHYDEAKIGPTCIERLKRNSKNKLNGYRGVKFFS